MAVNEISGFLKFKDANGDTNLLFPITTKDNVDGLDEIENELANAVKVTSQTLTEEQKTQARENIGAAPDGTVSVENGGVPTYAGATEGAFLRVVEGVPAWSVVPNAEEARF